MDNNSSSYLLNDLESEYKVVAPMAEELCIELSKQFAKLLEGESLSLGVPIEYRVKEWIKIPEKLERESLKFKSLKDLNDLIGFRLILLFRRDLQRICDLIANNFRVIKRYDTQDRLKEDQFGYSSVHFIIELQESWLDVPTFAKARGFKIEVQIRTVAQHIWAAASHVLQYKQEASVPPSLRRSIHRVSALLEIVDLEFERVLAERELYRANVNTSHTEETLNVDLLEKILDRYLPPKNKEINGEPYAQLLEDLQHFGVQNTSDLNTLINRQLTNMLKDEAQLVEHHRKTLDRSKAHSHTVRRLDEGVVWAHVGLVRLALGHEFGNKWEHYILAKSLERGY